MGGREGGRGDGKNNNRYETFVFDYKFSHVSIKSF